MLDYKIRSKEFLVAARPLVSQILYSTNSKIVNKTQKKIHELNDC